MTDRAQFYTGVLPHRRGHVCQGRARYQFHVLLLDHHGQPSNARILPHFTLDFTGSYG